MMSKNIMIKTDQMIRNYCSLWQRNKVRDAGAYLLYLQ